MPVIIPVLAAQAIAHGLRIAGLRILPYIIRSKTARAASEYATKKVGQKSITHSGYIVITKDPTKFRIATEIFGKGKVFRSDKILQAQSTAEKEIIPLTQRILKSASPEVRTTILNQADDAANGISKFIAHPRSNPVIGGTKEVTKEFKKFFGKDWKPINKNTIEAIKITERGPLSVSKDVAKVIPKPGTTVGKPKTILETTRETVKPAPKIDKKLPVNVETITPKRPWYVNIMPKYLRTTKDVMVEPYKRVVTEGVAKGKLARDVAIGSAAIYGYGKMTGPDKSPVQAEKGIEIDVSELFGGEPEIYKQQELTSGIDFYDTDEEGNVIQAQ